MSDKLIDPDCANDKHRSCVGGLCECSCHWTTHGEASNEAMFFISQNQPEDA